MENENGLSSPLFSPLPFTLGTCWFAENLDHDRHRDEEAVGNHDHQIEEYKGEAPQPTLHDKAQSENGENQHQVQPYPCCRH